MSIKIPRWFGVPPELFEKGILPKMSHSDLRLLLYAYWQSDKRSSRRFQTTDEAICRDAGLSPRSLRDSRINLYSLGLLFSEREPGKRFSYELCDLHTGQPYPGDPKKTPPYVKKAERTNENEKAITFQSSKAVCDLETDFNFGHNVQPASPCIDMGSFNPFK